MRPRASTVRTALVAALLALSACASADEAGATHRPPPATERAVAAALARNENSGLLFAYSASTDPSTMLNAFALPDGLVVVWPYATQERGLYRGERFEVTLLDTNDSTEFDPATPAHDWAHVGKVKATVTPLPDGDSEIQVGKGEALVTLRLSDLVRWRLRCVKERVKLGDATFWYAQQGWDASYVFFADETVQRGLDPDAPWRSLTPAYVAPLRRREVDGSWTKLEVAPIGDTGYVVRWRPGGGTKVELAR